MTDRRFIKAALLAVPGGVEQARLIEVLAILDAVEPLIRSDERVRILSSVRDAIERQHPYEHLLPPKRGVTDCGCGVGHVLAILNKIDQDETVMDQETT